MKPKVCVDARMLFSSGIGTYLQQIIPRMASSFELFLLVSEEGKLWSKEFPTAIFDAPIYSLKEQLFYPKKIPLCDLYWAPHYNIPFFPIRASKQVVTIHDVCHMACAQFFPVIKRTLARYLLQKAVQKADLVITVSEFSKKEITKYVSCHLDAIHVIHNGVIRREECNPFWERTWNIKQPFILYVGNHKPHKNMACLLQAFFLLPKAYDLVIVSPNRSSIHHHPAVHYFHDLSIEELFFLYKKASVLVHPSLYEGFGLVPLEAMQWGCPTIVSSVASLPEVCKDASLYIDPYSVDSLYLGMKQVLEDAQLQEALIQKGYERVKTFSWDQAAKDLIQIFLTKVL